MSLRRTILALAIACLAIGAAVAANVALLGLMDRPQSGVGHLQLRLGKQSGHPATSSPAPPLMVTSPPAPPRVDDQREGPDD
jgi:hypothetical protein